MKNKGIPDLNIWKKNLKNRYEHRKLVNVKNTEKVDNNKRNINTNIEKAWKIDKRWKNW